MEPLLDLRLLRVFMAVSEGGNMTDAAKRLGLTQPAVSQNLRQLEDELGVQLFGRERRPLQLTAAGILLQQQAAGLLQQMAQLPGRLQEASRTKLTRIRVGLVDSFAATIGPFLIRSMMAETMHLAMWSGLAPSHGEALMQRSLDLAITSDPLEDVDALVRHPILREPFILLVPAADRDALRGLDLREIAARSPLIRYSARSHIGGQVERHLRRLRVEAPRRLEVDGSDALVAMVSARVGWSITTPLCLLQGRAHAGGVAPLPLPGPATSRSIVLLARDDEYQDLPARVGAQARRLYRTEVAHEIRRLVPWLKPSLEELEARDAVEDPSGPALI